MSHSGVLTGTTKSNVDNKETEIKVSKQNQAYHVEYPALRCKGTLEVISTTATEMLFKVNFTEGSCLEETWFRI